MKLLLLLWLGCIICYCGQVSCFGHTRSVPSSPRTSTVATAQSKAARLIISGFGLATFSSQVVRPSSVWRANAAQGTLKSSTLAEAKEAAMVVKKCLDGTLLMEKVASSGDYDTVGEILSRREYQEFEKAASVLVRSDELTADEKITLGTIKRYGVVADAIIMLGGLAGQLKAGGIKVTNKSSSLQAAIEEEDADDESQLDPAEVKKYIKLSKDSLRDVYKIVAPILSK